MVQQYVFTVAFLTPEVARALAVYPGVAVRGKTITVPANAAWMVESVFQSAGLKYHVATRNDVKPCPDIASLPGIREWVPGFLTSYQREGLAAMYGRSGLFLWAAGCLAGDTEVVVNRGGAAKRMLIRDLVHKFNGGTSAGGKAWDLAIPTYVQSFDEARGVIVKNQVTAAVASGVKRTIWMQTFSGKEIRATSDHRFLTPTGWKKMGELREGDEVLVEKWPEAGEKKGKKPQYKYVDHMWNHPHAVRKVWERKDREEGALRRTAQVALHRLVMEAALNGTNLESWVGRIVMNRVLPGSAFLPHTLHVHHIDGDTSNNSILNLKVLSEEEHHQLHAAEGGWKRVMAKALPDRIKYIVGHGEEETFDLSMAAPHHNFIANGIVVHNSGKTIGSVIWALGKGATIVVTRAGVRRQYGREIERVTEHRAYVLEDTAAPDQGRLDESMFVVLGWETLPAHLNTLLAWRPSAIIYDEIHKCKSNKRFAPVPQKDGTLTFESRDNIAYAAYRLSRAVKWRLGATATPIKDRTRDLWAQLDLVEPDAWGRFYAREGVSFTSRYCAARLNPFGGVDTTGSSNLDELWNRVSMASHHVPHSVTHRDLPPRRRIVTYITRDDQTAPSGGFAKELAAASKNGKTAILEVRLAEAASRKRKAVVERVEECVEGGQKVLIFTGRRMDCDKLTEAIKKAVGAKANVYSGHGGTSAKDRDGIQQAYMADPGPCVLVGTGDAWGEGVNLQDTDTFLVVMLPFTPGQIVQWEGRVARHGQKRPVLIEYLLAEGTVDEHVGQVLLEKLPAVEEVAKDDSVTGFADALQGFGRTEEEIIDSVFAMLANVEVG